jgi:hypothetical protein
MVDARLPGRWLNSPRHDDLSDAAWRVYTCGLMYAAEQGTDGFIPTRALRLLHSMGAHQAAVLELVERGHWAMVEGGVRHIDWEHTQTTAEQLAHQRERSRENSKKSRDQQKSRDAKKSSVTGHVPEDVTVPGQGNAMQGKAMQGDARKSGDPRSDYVGGAAQRDAGTWSQRAVQVPGQPGRWLTSLDGDAAVWCGLHTDIALDDDGWCESCLIDRAGASR